jgi:opacity protein-like surface antigen
MFKRSIILGAALAVLVPMAAHAADMAVKYAPRANTIGTYDAPASGCIPQSCSGWYAGFGILGDGSNQDVSGGGVDGRVFSTGGALKLQAGYQLWNGQWFAAIEAGVGYEFTTNASGAAIVGRNGSRFIGTELVKLGYNFFPSTAVASPVAGQSSVPLTVPANLLASSTPYLTMGGMQRRGISEWVTGVGVQTVIASGWATDVKYLHAPAQQGQPATSVVMFELNKHF